MDERTDPWKWYCRIEGDTGEADTREERDKGALAHREVCRVGRRENVETAEHGRLIHIWSWGDPVPRNIDIFTLRSEVQSK